MALSVRDNKMVIALVICMLATASLASKSYPVTTLLNAKYNVTPVCLEVAEYLFDENPSLFWDYAENLNQLKTPLYEIGKNAPVAGPPYPSEINRNGLDLLLLLHLQIAIRRVINRRFRPPKACWERYKSHC